MALTSGEPPKFEESPGSRRILFAALALIPLAALSGVGMDFGMRFIMTEKLNAVAQSALASALAQSRALRDGRFNVSVEEMELKGRSRADIVFNAQKPNVRDISTTFTLKRNGPPNVFDARVGYVASVSTVFLRFAGLPELEIEGSAGTSWIARDAIIADNFAMQEAEALAAGRVSTPAPSGWLSTARMRVDGAPVVQLAAARRYAGPPAPEAVKVAVELDTEADGNVAISKKFSAEPGAHQLRYWYKDRAEDAKIAPAWLCGARLEDVDWMSQRDSSPAAGTNRMSVYLSAVASDGAPPMSDVLTGSTRIDSCYSSGYRWIERTVKIDILARGEYWLTFRGEGRSDGTGAAIANILLCREPCSDDGGLSPPQPNYPWRPNETIFEERFIEPAGSPPPHPAGWTVWPGRAVGYRPAQGSEPGYVELDARNGDRFENQKMGRPFLLVPGFYQLRYDYSVGPTSSQKVGACNYFGLEAALQRIARTPGADTHRVTVIIDPDRLYLHPEARGSGDSTRIDWFSSGRLPDHEPSLQYRSFLPDPANAVDYCVGAPPDAVVQREVNFRIDKAGYYWITFVGDGPADGQGGRIGAVSLSAQGTRFSGDGIPRIIRYMERTDATSPPIGASITLPQASSGQRALYRVQVQ